MVEQNELLRLALTMIVAGAGSSRFASRLIGGPEKPVGRLWRAWGWVGRGNAPKPVSGLHKAS